MRRLILFILLFMNGCSLRLAVTNTLNVSTPIFSPDGRHILVTISSGSVGELYKCDINSYSVEKITNNSRVNYSPRYSPDGQKIVFCSARDNQANLHIINSDGKDEYVLTTGLTYDYSPIFSPDGKKVYFLRATKFGYQLPPAMKRWGHIDIYSISVDGSNLKPLTSENYSQVDSLSITPDGKYLLVEIHGDKADSSLCLVSTESPEMKSYITPNMEKYKANIKDKLWAKESLGYNCIYSPQISPDGRFVLFIWPGHYQGYFGHELYVMNYETKDTQKITDMRSMIISPSFSSTGDKIVFLLDEQYADRKYSGPKIWIVNSNGEDLKAIDVMKIRGLGI